MKFILRIDLKGAAFDDGAAPSEVVRILREAAEQIEGWQDLPGYFQNLRDVNGNTVGQYAAKPDDYDTASLRGTKQ